MATIYIENRPYELKSEGTNLLEACLSLGFDIPYFCWHPAMHSVGACRMCAVKQFHDANDTRGRLVMSCMTLARDGMRISIDDPEAVDFRRRVIEWLMINHPHDCPVCDEGGECHLQDMTVMAGHVYRRHRFAKRTYRNQDLGPFVNHEMNRCIHCYRCVRFYRGYAGGRDLHVMGWHDHVYFGRHADGPLESPYSGNLVEVCPTGVFTDKTFMRHYTRKWDLQTAPSLCVHCGVGCNTIPGERYGLLRRIHSRYNHQVNGYFVCDRGRFGYEFVNSDRRIRSPMRREGAGQLAAAPASEVLRQAGQWLRDGRAIGIGSSRASLESNFALGTLVGSGRFYHGMSGVPLRLLRTMLEMLRDGPAPSASLQEVDGSDAVLVLGEDVGRVAPMLALAMRQAVLEKPMAVARQRQIHPWEDAVLREAVQQDRGPMFICTPTATMLDDQATIHFPAAPNDVARLAMAIAHALDASAPAVEGLPENTVWLAELMATGMKWGQRPVVVSGLSCGSDAVIRAAGNVAWAMCKAGLQAKLCFTVPECNSFGAAMLEGEGLERAAEAVRSGQADTVIILESDVFRHLDEATTETLLSARHVLVLDHLANRTTERAELMLPAATFAEADGTLVNNEGRAQRFVRVFQPAGDVRASWHWLGELMVSAGHAKANPWLRLDDVLAAMAKAVPSLAPAAQAAPPADYRMTGRRIPRQSHRYSGRTAISADRNVNEPQPLEDESSPLAFSMEGHPGQPPAALIPRYWEPGWNSCQAVFKFQEEVDGPLRGGDSGRRLAEPANARPAYCEQVPAAFKAVPGQWLIVPAYEVFGSEELSVSSPGVAQRIPRPYVAIGAKEARKAGLTPGQSVTVTVAGVRLDVEVRVHAVMPDGVAAIPVGLPGQPTILLPAWGSFSAGTKSSGRREGAQEVP